MGLNEKHSLTISSEGLILCPRKARSHITCEKCAEIFEEARCGEHRCQNHIHALRAIKEKRDTNERRNKGNRKR